VSLQTYALAPDRRGPPAAALGCPVKNPRQPAAGAIPAGLAAAREAPGTAYRRGGTAAWRSHPGGQRGKPQPLHA